MKALPVWQPWASLIAVGAKRIETRDYPPARLGLYPGQRIAIHAAKTDKSLYYCALEPFSRHVPDPEALPLGAIVATATLERASHILTSFRVQLQAFNREEYEFGDYQSGRWAWHLSTVQQLREPLPWRGRQGTFDVPDELITQAGGSL